MKRGLSSQINGDVPRGASLIGVSLSSSAPNDSLIIAR